MFAILSAQLQGAGRVLAVDQATSRLQQARRLGAEVIDFSREDPVQTLRHLTGGTGPDRIIDAVGIDAESPGDDRDPGSRQEVDEIAPDRPADDSPIRPPGDAPSQALRWEVDALAKAGTLSIVGVYAPADEHFPIGMAMNKNLTIKTGNCNRRKYVPELVALVRAGVVSPSNVISQIGELQGAIEAYEAFDQRREGWHKVVLDPSAA